MGCSDAWLEVEVAFDGKGLGPSCDKNDALPPNRLSAVGRFWLESPNMLEGTPSEDAFPCGFYRDKMSLHGQ
jgi:hypothetical protein